MKSILNTEVKPQPIKYPWLGILKSSSITKVVLFTSHREGTVVYSNDSFDSVGTYITGWAIENFEKYQGSITLSND